jgi:hypothetical protein
MSEVKFEHKVHLLDISLQDSQWKAEKFLFDLNNSNCFHDLNANFLSCCITTGGSVGSSFRQTIHEWGNPEKGKLIPRHAYICVAHFWNQTIPNNDLIGKTIDFSFDLMSIVGDVLYALAIRQDNMIFMAKKHSCLIKKQTKWTQFSHKNLKPQDFYNMSKDAAQQHPDFNNLKSLQFGFVTMNSTTQSKAQTISGLDNYCVTLNCDLSPHKSEKIKLLKIKLKEEEKARSIAELNLEKLHSKLSNLEQELNTVKAKLREYEDYKEFDVVPVVFESKEEHEKKRKAKHMHESFTLTSHKMRSLTRSTR